VARCLRNAAVCVAASAAVVLQLRCNTPVNGGTGRHSDLATTIQNALFRSSSTVEQAAVNRKVQGSNPCSGAKSEYESLPNL
jgi:hypothetical protein